MWSPNHLTAAHAEVCDAAIFELAAHVGSQCRIEEETFQPDRCWVRGSCLVGGDSVFQAQSSYAVLVVRGTDWGTGSSRVPPGDPE